MFSVYVLYSFSHDKFYTGFTSNLIQRFYSHNFLGDKDWTRNYRPWVVIYVEIFEFKLDALKREKELKSGKGREWIKHNLINFIEPFTSSNPLFLQ